MSHVSLSLIFKNELEREAIFLKEEEVSSPNEYLLQN
jgi:hypothetical protein